MSAPRACLPLLVLLASACVADPVDVATATHAVTSDPVRACPIPDRDAIAGDESVFYRCAEDELAALGRGCGLDGYLLGYGARYAERFYRDTRPTMSTRGRVWIDDVLVCLQDELRASIDVDTSCPEIRTIAFDSHPGCYVEAGFCTLPFSDLLRVVATVDASDWLSADAARQVVTTAARCSRSHAFWMSLLFGAGD